MYKWAVAERKEYKKKRDKELIQAWVTKKFDVIYTKLGLRASLQQNNNNLSVYFYGVSWLSDIS